MVNDPSDRAPQKPALHAEVEERFGVLPNFFQLAPSSPEITENLWGFAKFGYLDNPLPSLLKERLFVYLSQFCEVRYCIARHVGFLIGLGRPAGDRSSDPETPEQIVRLLRRGFPQGAALDPHLALLQSRGARFVDLPTSETEEEEALFACVAHVFLQTSQANRCLEVLQSVLEPATHQHLLVLITFIRTAHFWTKVHPELQQESDILQLWSVHEALAECVLKDNEAKQNENTQLLIEELAELREEREEAELLRVTLASIGDAVIATDAKGCIVRLNEVAEELTAWTNREAIGQPLDLVFQIVNEQTRKPVESPATRALREGVIVGLANHTILIAKDGTERPIDDSAAPIRLRQDKIVGCVLVFRDVTERRRLETENEEREKHARFLAAIVTSSEDAIISKTLDGTIQSWNAAAERIFGYSEEQAVGSHISLLIPPERAEEEEQIIARLRAGDRVEHFETVRLRRDGQRIPISLTISPIKDAAGKVIGASKIARDISDRQRTEQAIRESEIRKAAMLQTALDGIVTIDHQGMVVEFNPAAERLFGYSQAQVVGQEMSAFLIPPAMRARYQAGLTRYMQCGEGPILNKHLELPALGADGVEFPIELAITRISQSHPPLFTAYIRDISGRKQAERQMREHEQRFRTLVEQVEDYAIFMTDAKGRPTSWNEGVLRVLGFDEQAFVGKEVMPLIFTDVDIAQGVLHTEFKEAAAAGSVSNERWMTRRDGARFWAAGVTTALRNEQGELLGFMKVMRDQTEWKQLEEELRKVAAELSEADRRKTEFLATLGHELRNPLAPIRTGLEAIKLVKNDPEMLEQVCSTMERQVQQMVRLIDDLLDISRITQGKLELRTCRIAMSAVVQSAVEAMRPFVDEANHELTVTLPQQPIFVEADPNRLAQVFSNLLNNSTKYTPAGGRIWLTVELQESDVVVIVRDDGLGIPAEMLESIFEMFTQIDRPLEKGYSGLGIGLTLVKRLVELHGGDIDVLSAGADQGSEFRVRLPILTESPGAAEVDAAPHVAPRSFRVLVVDDNRAAAHMLSLVVRLLGNEVRVAHDGEQAIAVAAEFLPHVILMDLGMPKLDGYQAAQHLRKQPWGKQILLVALTGWGQEEDKARTREAGFDHHLVKPAEPAAIQELLRDYSTRQGQAN